MHCRQDMDSVQLGQLTTFLVVTSPQCVKASHHFNQLQPTRPFHRAGWDPSCLPALWEARHTAAAAGEPKGSTAGISPSPYIAAEQLRATYVASITTPTPAGCKASVMAIAICLVRRSWTERRTRSSEPLLNLTSLNASSSTHHRKDGIKILHPHFQVCLFPPLPAQDLVFLN